jgi:hypothetical protein
VPDDEREIDEHFAIVEPEEEGDGQSLEDDPRLLELAKQAAQCMHEILGVRYDESHHVDIGDIKFVVVELTLPLGSKCQYVEILRYLNVGYHGFLSCLTRFLFAPVSIFQSSFRKTVAVVG